MGTHDKALLSEISCNDECCSGKLVPDCHARLSRQAVKLAEVRLLTLGLTEPCRKGGDERPENSPSGPRHSPLSYV